MDPQGSSVVLICTPLTYLGLSQQLRGDILVSATDEEVRGANSLRVEFKDYGREIKEEIKAYVRETAGVNTKFIFSDESYDAWPQDTIGLGKTIQKSVWAIRGNAASRQKQGVINQPARTLSNSLQSQCIYTTRL